MELTLDQALQKGIEAHKAGDIEDADRYYTAILKANPDHPDANHNMGVLAVGVGQVQEALPFFKKAVEVNSSIEQFWLSYIDALITLDRIDDAKAVYQQAESAGAKGDGFNQVESRLINIARIEDDQVNKEILNKAIELRENGKYNEAIDFLTNSSNNFLQDPNILATLSHCHILNGNLAEASIHLETAKSINPNTASVKLNETRLLLKQNKVKEALVIAKKTNESFPDDVDSISVLGSCLIANGDIKESLRYLNKAIEFNPNYAEALINRGLIWLKQENKTNALIDLEKAHNLKPHIKQIWDLVISLKIELKQFEDTITLAKGMYKLDPRNEKVSANIALCYQNLKIYDQAQAFYEKAISLKPDFVDAYYNMGTVFQDQGKLEQAIEAYKKSISLKPSFVEAYNNLGVVLKDQGKLEEAIEVYKKALLLKPDFFELHLNLSKIKKYKLDDEHLVQVKELYKCDNLSTADSCRLNFTLAKMYEDTAQLGKAFTHLSQGNSLRKKLLNYN